MVKRYINNSDQLIRPLLLRIGITWVGLEISAIATSWKTVPVRSRPGEISLKFQFFLLV